MRSAKGYGTVGLTLVLGGLTPVLAYPTLPPESGLAQVAFVLAIALEIGGAVVLGLAGAAMIVSRRRLATHRSLAGIWRSEYEYQRSSDGNHYVSEHVLVLRERGDALAGLSLPKQDGSRVELRLSWAGRTLLQGTWTEHTSPSEHYAGRLYFGVMQLAVDVFSDRMTGTWCGFGSSMEVNSGSWRLTRLDSSTRRGARRRAVAALSGSRPAAP